MARPSRALALFALPAGLVVGLAGCFLQQWSAGPAPLGPVLALAALVGVLLLAGLAAGRPGVAAGAAGWVLAVVAMLWPRPEGDLVLAATGSAYTFLLGGLAVCGAALTVPARRRGAAPLQPGGDPTDARERAR